jgi:hypothetical protein
MLSHSARVMFGYSRGSKLGDFTKQHPKGFADAGVTVAAIVAFRACVRAFAVLFFVLFPVVGFAIGRFLSVVNALAR